MRRLFFVLAIMSLGIGVVTAQTKTLEKAQKEETKVEVDGPIMTFEADVVDYGEIEENADPYRYFKFTNTGNQPLIITSAKGSCGCTVPTYPQEAIEPGESGEIKVRYATNRIGPFKKTVTLTTNVEGSETTVLTIKGKVNKKAEAPSGVPASENNIFKSTGNSKNNN